MAWLTSCTRVSSSSTRLFQLLCTPLGFVISLQLLNVYNVVLNVIPPRLLIKKHVVGKLFSFFIAVSLYFNGVTHCNVNRVQLQCVSHQPTFRLDSSFESIL